MQPGRDISRAILTQYWRAMLSRGGVALLLGGLCLNLLIHHFLFNIISNAVQLYRSMTAIMFGLSLDFFALALIVVSGEVYDRFRSTNIYRDLDLSGIPPWAALRPLLVILVGLTWVAGLVQSLVGAVLSYESWHVLLSGVVVGMLHGIVAASFLAFYITAANLYRVPKLAQLFIQIALGFAMVLCFDWLSGIFQPYLQNLPEDSLLHRLTAATDVSSWRMYSTYYAYYLALLVQAAVLLPVVWFLYRRTKASAARVLIR